MINYITPSTLANTVRMGAKSRRPKAVFLSSDVSDLKLLEVVATNRECRIIPAHTRENAVNAFQLLVNSGYKGVFTAVNARFAPASDEDVISSDHYSTDEILSIEGPWEEIRNKNSLLSGRSVRVTFLPKNGGAAERIDFRNLTLMRALEKLAVIRKDIHPKSDKRDYLREAREGGMYDIAID